MKNPAPKSDREPFNNFIYPVREKRLIPSTYLRSDRDFLTIMEQRRSRKITTLASQDRLHELLYRSARIHSTATDVFGNELTRRATPSAGAIHPIDILYSLPATIHERRLEYYNPKDNSLSTLELESNYLTSFFEHINTSMDISKAYILWFAIQPKKTESKYTNPESLYWRDAGALLYNLQLVANYLGLSTLPVGTLAIEQFKNLFGDDLLSGGGILAGS